MKKKDPMFEYVESISALIPSPFYWFDTNGCFVGLNDLTVKAMGIANKADLIGKNVYDIYEKKEIADKLQADILNVVKTGKISQTEDVIYNIDTGEPKYFSASRAPLKNKRGKIIGVVGTSIEITAEKKAITAQKEAERLKLENERLELENKTKDIELQLESETNKAKILQFQNEAYQATLKEQERFGAIVGQMLHDIQSPLASLRMTVESTTEIPEQKRITLRTSAMNIMDITSHLLSHYNKDDSLAGENNKRQTVLVSSILSEVISDKRYRYKSKQIEFEYKLNLLNAFLFIKVEPSDLKRSISNLINNAVDALFEANSKIELKLSANEEWVYLTLLDNGKGIPRDVLDKIKNQIAVTNDKENGHGIGLTQVWDMLERNYGKFSIVSSQHKQNHGTTITLQFPKRTTPDWVIQEISLTKHDTVIILDDDKSIHGAWESRFEYIIKKEPGIVIKHFYMGDEVLNYINGLTAREREHICLLSDYELINQNLNGLEVIKQCQIKRSILVTSHHTNFEISKIAIQNNVKILPKELVYAVPFNIIKHKKDEPVNVHMVLIDDERIVTQTLIAEYYSHLIVDTYSNPFEFLEEVTKYPKDTKFIIDNCYYAPDGSTYNIDGISIAKQLYENGYTNLFLLSGENFNVPDYLKIILKTDKKTIANLDKL